MAQVKNIATRILAILFDLIALIPLYALIFYPANTSGECYVGEVTMYMITRNLRRADETVYDFYRPLTDQLNDNSCHL
jgi:hypothetical protein